MKEKRGHGYSAGSARKGVWQFMKSGGPSISVLRRFANTTGISLEELLAEGNKKLII